jgi:hypothetical protein
MASIEAALYDKLSKASAVTALVSTRIYPVLAAQSVTGDYITYGKVSGQPHHTMQAPAGLRWARFSFYGHAGTYANAKAITDAVLATLDGLAETVAGVQIGACLSQEEMDLEFDDTARLYTRAVDFLIHYAE